MEKLCKDCEFILIPETGINFAKCTKYKKHNRAAEKVDGKKHDEYLYCEVQRLFSGLYVYFANRCGKRGRWFKPKKSI